MVAPILSEKPVEGILFFHPHGSTKSTMLSTLNIVAKFVSYVKIMYIFCFSFSLLN